MKFRKLENSGIPELDGKIIALTDNLPDRTHIGIGSNPSLWMLLEPTPIALGSYKMFYDVFAEERKLWVDGDIDIFNKKLRGDTFLPAKIKKTFDVNGTRFIVLDINDEMCFVLLADHRPLADRPNMSGGKDGFFWTERFYKRRITQAHIRDTFGLSKSEAKEFMIEFRK